MRGPANCAESFDLASDARWIDHDHARPERRHPAEVGNIKRQQVCCAMRMAHGDKAGVMHLFADYAQRAYEGLPCGVDIRRVRQQREFRLECGCMCFRVHDR